MAKFTDVVRNDLIAYFQTGDQPTQAQFTELITAIQEGIEEHDHSGTGDGDGEENLVGPIRIGAIGVPGAQLDVYDPAVNTAAAFIGFRAEHWKTDGATDETINLFGGRVKLGINDADKTHGECIGMYAIFEMDAGEIGTNIVDKFAAAERIIAKQDGGKIWGDLYGFYLYVDQAVGAEVTDDIKIAWLRGDADGTVGGTVYMLHLDALSNVDYGIYQTGTAPNYLNSSLTITDLAGVGVRNVSADANGKLVIS
jgi:hypothetical protein